MADQTLRLPDVPDVLHHVFSYLDPIHYSDEEISKSRQSLMMAARTCRGFSGPALDVLWKRLPDDQPLVDLLCTIGITDRELKQDDTALLDEHQLPRHEQRLRAWRCAEGYDIQYFLQDAGDPRQHPGWPRFVEYATRVHAICLFAFDGPAWCSLWQQLLIATEGAPILPKLVSVAFCNVRTRRAICPEALALVSLSVRTLNFNIKPEGPWTGIDEKTGPLFSQIFETAPEIEQLRLRVLPFRLGAPFFRARCSRLRHLEVGPHLGLEGLSVLTELPTLQYLSISLVDPGRGSSTAPLLTLKSVTTLVMNGRWTALNGALGSMRLPSMRSLVLEGPGYDESAFNLAKGATECFRTIPRHTSITSLSISTKYSPPPDSTGFGYFTWAVEDAIEAPLLDFMHPLLSLSNLRDVSLSFPSFFILASTSSDLRTIAESWPALETFHLSVSLRRDGHNRRVYQPLSRHPSRDDVNSQSDVSVSDTYRYPKDYAHGAPLEAIAHFARFCPRLRVLRLSAMEMSEDSLAAAVALLGSAPAPAEPHGLRTLSIWRVLLPPGRKDLFEKVPKLVGAVFPRVKFPFRAPRRGRDLEDDPEDDEWVYAYACTPRHPVCERERKLTFWP